MAPPWRIGWTTNRLLVGAVVAGLALLVFFLYVPPVADLLDQAPPTFAGFAVALLAIPAVLVADALHKRWRVSHGGQPGLTATPSVSQVQGLGPFA